MQVLRRYGVGGALLAIAAVLASVAKVHEVDIRPTEEDRASAAYLLKKSDFPHPMDFDAEIALVRHVQRAVLAAAPVNKGIPEGQPRELADLLRAGQGNCYDRSRAIETLLRLHGLPTRHVAIFSMASTGSALRSLLTPQVQSHAVSEVLTRKGWMVIGSNSAWISLATDGTSFSLDDIRNRPDLLNRLTTRSGNDIFEKPFVHVYGLYSRHGRFYPPYTPIPDMNFAELFQSLTGN